MERWRLVRSSACSWLQATTASDGAPIEPDLGLFGPGGPLIGVAPAGVFLLLQLCGLLLPACDLPASRGRQGSGLGHDGGALLLEGGRLDGDRL